MARPRKGRFRSDDITILNFFNGLPEEQLPREVYLLQATVGALIKRIRLMNEETARQLDVFITQLAVRATVWRKRKSKSWERSDASEEWRDYCEILEEIALGKTSRRTHCKETVILQGRWLDRYLSGHYSLPGNSDFMKCRNSDSRRKWILNHANVLNDILSLMPCFCYYKGKIVEKRGSKALFVEPHWLKSFLNKGVWTPVLVREAWLAMLHGTTMNEIAQIRKGPSSFSSRANMTPTLEDFLWTSPH